jgi:hypothetical protein
MTFHNCKLHIIWHIRRTRDGWLIKRFALRQFRARRLELRQLIAKSTGVTSPFSKGDRVFHIKFGNGNVVAVDGNKLTIQFDKAGEKRVVDSFVERV